MTPKEKAEQLVSKFNPFVYCYIGSSMLTNDADDGVILMMSKKCALISCDEILEHIDEIKTMEYHFGKSIAYWKDVKEEIEKL